MVCINRTETHAQTVVGDIVSVSINLPCQTYEECRKKLLMRGETWLPAMDQLDMLTKTPSTASGSRPRINLITAHPPGIAESGKTEVKYDHNAVFSLEQLFKRGVIPRLTLTRATQKKVPWHQTYVNLVLHRGHHGTPSPASTEVQTYKFLQELFKAYPYWGGFKAYPRPNLQVPGEYLVDISLSNPFFEVLERQLREITFLNNSYEPH